MKLCSLEIRINWLPYFPPDVCSLRLDFETFDILGPASTDELEAVAG